MSATYQGNSKTRVISLMEAFQEGSWGELGKAEVVCSAGKRGFSQVERTEAKSVASRVKLNWGD